MSSNPRASRGASWNTCVAPLNRYTAVTFSTFAYDVLNTRTSDTNGTPPCPVADAAAGNVTVSAEAAAAANNADANNIPHRAIRWVLYLVIMGIPKYPIAPQ